MIRAGCIVVLLALATPAAAATSVTCAGAVTLGQGSAQTVRDLTPSDLPVLAYGAAPGEREFKQLARIGDVPVRLYAYRVNDAMTRLRIYEPAADGPALLADTELHGEMTQLSYRPIGSDTLVTAWCY